MSASVPPDRLGRVCVTGSLNLDHVASVSALPAPGQTVTASGFVLRHGGKGANQAVAAARQGATVSMIGAIGQDAAGTAYRERLLNEGIAVQHIKETEEPTGTALINLLPSGENTIVVFPGANQTLSPEDVTWAGEAIQSAEILLVQLEVPVETVVNAIQIANRSGTRVIFNPSPFRPDFPWAEVFIDVLIVNEGEAEQLDATAPDGEDLPIGCLIITHGAEPVEVIMPDGDFTFQPPSVTPVDTVGAGDTFAGTLAARLALGDSIQSAVAIANTAAARSTLQVGAQEAMPYAAEIGV